MSRRRGRMVLAAASTCAVLAVVALLAHRYLEAGSQPARAARLASELGIRPGMTVAEIGAGYGGMAVEMARVVGSRGQVYATELGARQLDAIRSAARRANLGNLTVVVAGEHEANLPEGCCDAVYMQRVYHHLTDPAGIIASVRHALKPGGRLALVEFEPNWIRNWSAPRGVPDRGGHGVPKGMLVREMRSFGFGLRGGIAEWPDWEYVAVFSTTTSDGLASPRRATPAIPMVAGIDVLNPSLRPGA